MCSTPWVWFMPTLTQYIPTQSVTYGSNRWATPTTGRSEPCMNTSGRRLPSCRLCLLIVKYTVPNPYTTRHLLRRHKLPTPHLTLWPTEVHIAVRGKVCEKGCYFLGIHTPLVATCKNKVCISNICHYLHFWQHTDFQNKGTQSPKYSVILHLDHCIPVRGGGGSWWRSVQTPRLGRRGRWRGCPCCARLKF